MTAMSLSFETQARKGSPGQGLSCSLTAKLGIQIPTDLECVTVTSCPHPHRLLSGWLQSPGAPGEEERRQVIRHAGPRKNSTPEPVPTQRALSDTLQVERGGLRGDLSDRQSRTTSQVPDTQYSVLPTGPGSVDPKVSSWQPVSTPLYCPPGGSCCSPWVARRTRGGSAHPPRLCAGAGGTFATERRHLGPRQHHRPP